MPQPKDVQKVGYVLKRYPRYSETFIVNEILAHEAAGLEVYIFSLYPPSDTHFQDALARVRAPVIYLNAERVKAAELWEFLMHARRVLPAVQNIFEAARGEDIRTVHWALMLALEVQKRGLMHLHAHFGSVATGVARLAAHFAELPYTFTAHAKDIFHESVETSDLSRKLSEAAAVVTVSDYNLRYLQDLYGDAAHGVRRVYNGMDLTRFSYASPAARPPHIISVGRLVEKKGFNDLIEACAVLRARGKKFRCTIIGTGELEAKLRTQIACLSLEREVELLGPRPQRELATHIQDAAAFAAPCIVGRDGNRDGLPTVLLEAMALGTPCVSTDVTGIPEVVRHEETGLQVPQHQPDLLADALERLLENGALRVRLAEKARALIEQDFDIHRSAAALRAIFAETSRSHPTRVESVPQSSPAITVREA